MFSTVGGYHDKCGDMLSTMGRGDVQYLGGIMSTVGDTLSTVGDSQ